MLSLSAKSGQKAVAYRSTLLFLISLVQKGFLLASPQLLL